MIRDLNYSNCLITDFCVTMDRQFTSAIESHYLWNERLNCCSILLLPINGYNPLFKIKVYKGLNFLNLIFVKLVINFQLIFQSSSERKNFFPKFFKVIIWIGNAFWSSFAGRLSQFLFKGQKPYDASMHTPF